MLKNIFSVVDLFAGAGGLSEGFRRKGFQVISSIEMDVNACETLKTRHFYWDCIKKKKEDFYWDYVKNEIKRNEILIDFPDNAVINEEISYGTIKLISNKIRKRMEELKISSIDVFIGGPPCQAYSVAGRARDPKRMKDDPRKELYKYYVELLKEFTPKIFVFENVPGILSSDHGFLFTEIKKLFKNADYTVEHCLLNAADFMVLENRKRVILIGWKKDENLRYPKFKIKKHNYFINELFKDLPLLKPGDGRDISGYKDEATCYLKKSKIRKNETILIHHLTRPLNKNDKEIYKEAIILWNTNKKRLNYSHLSEYLKTHKNQTSFLDRFKVVAANEKTSQTIVAHIARDGHYYIHPDIEQLRSISVREAARIQSFPDNYYFEGPRTSKLVQIGNAVPPLMAEAIAEKIKEMLNERIN